VFTEFLDRNCQGWGKDVPC